MTRASRHFQNVNQVNTSKIKSIFSCLIWVYPDFLYKQLYNTVKHRKCHINLQKPQFDTEEIYIYMLSPPHPYFSNCTNTKCSALWLSLLCIDRLGTTLCLYRCIMLRCEWNTIDNRLVTSDQSQLCVELSCNALHVCCNASYARCNFT